MLRDNTLYNIDCLEGLRELPENSVDLIVTSPPYDDIRSYGNVSVWDFDKFKEIAVELYRVLKPGCVLVWIVGDATKNGSETLTHAKQALYFKEEVGFVVHDSMIYEKNSPSFPAKRGSKRYTQIFEYMTIFTKGKIREDITLIADKRNKWSGWTSWGKQTQYNADEKVEAGKLINPVPEFSLRNNIWKYNVGFNDKTGHPAVFPEKLAEDHILSWSVKGNLVLDPFMGSGTTAKMAMLNGRNYIGFEVNEAYWKVSVDRVAKYKDMPVKVYETIRTQDDWELIASSPEPEDEKKAKLFKKLLEQMEGYFNTMDCTTLRNLRLQFASKANDRRVEKIEKERLVTEEGVTTADVVL